MALLNEPLTIKGIALPNRLVMPPMATSKSSERGMVQDGLCDYYDEKTRGGHIGLVIVEHSFISQQGKASDGQLSVAEPRCVEGLARLAAVIHRNGSKAIAQINHAGRQTSRRITGEPIVGPSAIASPSASNVDQEVPRALTPEEIGVIVNDFAQSAKYAQQAGFDGVEIHSAHGYLLNQFYSPLANARTDDYTGRTLEGRVRVHLQIIEAVRRAVGDEFLVALRLGASDYRAGGSTVDDGVNACALFEQAGVDLLDISGGLNGYTVPGRSEPGYFSDATGPIKRAVGVPVILTGGVTDGAAAERLLADGKADLIGVGRAILTDSRWAERAMLGSH